MKKQIFGTLLFAIMSVTAMGEIPRKEYPRPQFERKEWMNLNGKWTYSFDFGMTGHERGFMNSKGFRDSIMVPFAPETKLSGVKHLDFINGMWYHRTIEIPTVWSGKQIKLNFGGVYYTSEIYVDGVFVERHFGGSSSFSVDLTHLVRAGQLHHLVVFVRNDIRDGMQSAGKQNLQYHSYGCNYNRTTGIWQTVWMEPVDGFGLERVQVLADIDKNRVVVKPLYYKESGGELHVEVRSGKKTVASETISATQSSIAVLSIPKARLWSPEDPFLYELLYTLTAPTGEVVDQVSSYFGMRKVHIDGTRFFLNNKPFYQRLVLDQGFYPEGNWTAPSDDDLRRDILLAKEAGFNGARLHQKVFEERYHYWADQLGFVTWGEASSWGMDCNSELAARNFLGEWSEVVTRDRNHPSILLWTPLNEAWWPDRVQYPRFVKELYRLTKGLDATRPFHDASGGVHVVTDIFSVHHYEQDPSKLHEILWNGGQLFETPNYAVGLPQRNIGFNEVRLNAQYEFLSYKGNMPYLVDEFGGIKWSADQQNQPSSWGYGAPPSTLEEFYERLEGQVDAILSLSEYVWGYCYTQLTDVEQEQNGIYHYNRSKKFDMERIRKIFGKEPKQ